MKWIAGAIGLVLIWTILSGCKQQCFLHECDYDHYHASGLSPRQEADFANGIVPTTTAIPVPTTVRDTDRQIRYLSLSEAIAIALEQGNVGSGVGTGLASDNLVSYQGRSVAGDDSIRVLALDPAIVATDIEASLSKFDTRWTSSMTWTKKDVPVNGVSDQLQNGDGGTLLTGLLKPLPTGGVAGITFSTDYLLATNPPANVNQVIPGGTPINIVFLNQNPAYKPRLRFSFEQPLLQNFGVEINQIRGTHPGSLLTPFTTANRAEGILIARIRFDEQRAEFERNANLMLFNVEVAYWNLYGSYWTLYSREQALRQSYEAWRINQLNYDNGKVRIQDVAQSRQQYELFRGQRVTALGDVLERERQLRGLLGMPLEDCYRLVPCDKPVLAPFVPDWCTAANEALALRPELILAREELKYRRLELINQRNLLRPDLRFTSTYDVNGLGTDLDGPGPSNALRVLAGNQFTSWSMGLNLDMPLGFRDAHAAVRQANLNLARSYSVLHDQEDKVQRYLGLQYRRLFEYYDLFNALQAQREAATVQLQQRFEEFLGGRGTLDFLLESQRTWADTLRSEADAVVQYNNALAGFEYAKGTLLHHNNVTISEGPLPHCARERAVDHQRERTQALVLRELAEPIVQPACCIEPDKANPGVPNLPTDSAPSIPALFEGQQPLPNDRKNEPAKAANDQAAENTNRTANAPASASGAGNK